MIEFADFSFHYSDPGDPSNNPPSDFFSTLPFRTSKFKNEALKGARHAYNRLLNTVDSEAKYVISDGAITERCHYTSWLFPECPQDKVEQLAMAQDGFLYFDGILWIIMLMIYMLIGIR